MSAESKTIILIHGLWMTPRSWEYFQHYYEGCGYRVLVPTWPRMQGEVETLRANPSALAGLGLLEIAAHYEKIVRSLDEPPILIGHSMGGLVVQMLLDRGLGAAGISINGTAPKGVYRLPFSLLKAASPVLGNPLNFWRCVMLTFEEFHYAFASNMTKSDARKAYKQFLIPGPGRPVFQAAFANFRPWAASDVDYFNNDRVPLLLIAGAEDLLVPPILNRINYSLYQSSCAVTEYKEFPNRSHLIITQEGWEEVADFVLTWTHTGTKRSSAHEIPLVTPDFKAREMHPLTYH